MDETEFNKVAGQLIEHIADQVDEVLGDKIDVDFQSGILTLNTERGGQYVINKHGPNREIWVSSPVSGAAHFRHIEGRWLNTRNTEVDLLLVLGSELGLVLSS